MKALLLMIACMSLGLLGAKSTTAPTTAPDAEPTAIVRRAYDVRDLLAVAARPERSSLLTPRQLISGELTDPTPPVYVSGEGAALSPSESAARDLVGLIKTQVDPTGWAKPGLGQRTIDVFAGRLVVNQTPANQTAIADLLASLRAPDTVGRSMTIEAEWLLLAPGELEKLLSPARGVQASGEIDEAALAKLPASAVCARARSTAVDGNSVQLLAGRARNVVTATDVGVITGSAVNRQESVRQLSGAALRVTPRIRGDAALVDVVSFVGGWSPLGPVGDPPKAASATTRPIDADRGIDRVNLPMQQLVTSARLPLGKLLVIGGMTVEPDVNGAPPGDPLAKDGRQIYLLLRVTAP